MEANISMLASSGSHEWCAGKLRASSGSEIFRDRYMARSMAPLSSKKDARRLRVGSLLTGRCANPLVTEVLVSLNFFQRRLDNTKLCWR